MSDDFVSLPHASLILKDGQLPYSEAFGDVYHSAAGGPEQARHVFLRGNDLPHCWQGLTRFCILETGFGLGLNFLETWQAFDESAHAGQCLHFVSVENLPFHADDLARAHAAWPGHAARSRELRAQWPLPLKGFHRLVLGQGRVILTLLLGDALGCLRELDARFDAIYLDGFAPARNPDMWSPDLFTQLARLSRTGTSLATWSVAASVRQGLQAAGFELQRRPGFGSKRDMLTGRLATPCTNRTADMPDRAVVIGAGLAGTACAQALARRGIAVTVLDRHPAPAGEASGNPLGLCAPLLNPGDAANARLSRAAFLHAVRHYRALLGTEPAALSAAGALRVLRDPTEAARYGTLLDTRRFPPEFARLVPPEQMALHAGLACANTGIWFAQGMALDPRAACRRQLQHPRIDALKQASVQALRHNGGSWVALDGSGAVLASAPLLVVAGATGSTRLLPHLPLQPVRGQVSVFPWPSEAAPRCPVGGESYALTLPDGRLLVGATFQPYDEDPAIREIDHATNLQRLEATFPGLAGRTSTTLAEGRVGFRAVTPDRLPLVGAMDGWPAGLQVCAGLGARGIVWAPLAAEWLASRVCGEPMPLPSSLARALDAARFRATPTNSGQNAIITPGGG